MEALELELASAKAEINNQATWVTLSEGYRQARESLKAEVGDLKTTLANQKDQASSSSQKSAATESQLRGELQKLQEEVSLKQALYDSEKKGRTVAVRRLNKELSEALRQLEAEERAHREATAAAKRMRESGHDGWQEPNRKKPKQAEESPPQQAEEKEEEPEEGNIAPHLPNLHMASMPMGASQQQSQQPNPYSTRRAPTPTHPPRPEPTRAPSPTATPIDLSPFTHPSQVEEVCKPLNTSAFVDTLDRVKASHEEDTNRPFIKEGGDLTRQSITEAVVELNTVLQRIRIKGMAEGSIFKDRMDDLWRGVLVQPQGTLTTFIRMASFINSNGDFARAMRDGEEGCSTCDIDPSSTVDHLVKHSYREDTSCCPYGPGGNKKGCETCSHLQAVLSQQLGQKHKSSMCPIGANFTRYHKTAKA